ncbi:hypothetical protein [Archangium sp.]|uniref:hypothetical protein n=1 Tax=Archangium sp. TaxID=1872627 RepID=UPI002D3F540E|nr:hypothetical protein [Archangium sp.]HYO55645.1 hypothetical protein [Archangium sp.]
MNAPPSHARHSSPLQALRRAAFERLEVYLSPQHLDEAMRSAEKLYAALPHHDELPRNVVLVAYGGGKDSAYTLAFVRCIQLMLSFLHDGTFRLRVVTNRHAGMPRAVMENIHRSYLALALYADPDCEPLLIDGNEVKPFKVDEPLPAPLARRNRDDILMTGHRTFANGRPTFCNACNLSVVNSYGLAASYGGGVDLIITGDSRREQRAYLVWVRRLAQQFGLEPGEPQQTGFKRFLSTMDNISRAYFGDIHGHDVAAVHERRIATGVKDGLRFFSIYDDTGYSAGGHWELLIQHLGFRFDEIAFSFSESDCGNPALMAHLRGLKLERVYGRTYVEGITEYVQFALGLMRKKDFPPQLIEEMQARYMGDDAAPRMRAAMDAFALEAHGLSEEQLVCMVYSPFASRGQHLERYLSREHPRAGFTAREAHELLRDDAPVLPGGAAHRLAGELERMSGLSIEQLRAVYAVPLHRPEPDAQGDNLLDAILARDPHKATIATRQSLDGPPVDEIISGR